MNEPAASQSEAGRRLRRVLLGIATQARGDLERIRQCPSSGIHALRRRMKKFQSVLSLVRGHIPARTKNAIRRRVRFLKDAFAGQRDDEVMGRLALDIGGPALAARVGSRSHVPRLMPNAKHMGAAVSLEKLVAGLPIDALTWKGVASAYNRSARKAHKAWRAAVDDPTAERFHEWRKRIKAHYFQTLLLQPIVGRMRKRLERSGELGHWLGQFHDLFMLSQVFLQEAEKGDARWYSEIERRGAKLRDRIVGEGHKMHPRPGSKAARHLMKRIEAAGGT